MWNYNYFTHCCYMCDYVPLLCEGHPNRTKVTISKINYHKLFQCGGILDTRTAYSSAVVYLIHVLHINADSFSVKFTLLFDFLKVVKWFNIKHSHLPYRGHIVHTPLPCTRSRWFTL